MSRHSVILFGAAALMLAAIAGAATAGQREDAQRAFDTGDFATALKIYRQLAERGDADAETAIGKMYRDGRGVNARALGYYRPLADQGQLMAEYMVGLMYANNQGVSHDYGKAMK